MTTFLCGWRTRTRAGAFMSSTCKNQNPNKKIAKYQIPRIHRPPPPATVARLPPPQCSSCHRRCIHTGDGCRPLPATTRSLAECRLLPCAHRLLPRAHRPTATRHHTTTSRCCLGVESSERVERKFSPGRERGEEIRMT